MSIFKKPYEISLWEDRLTFVDGNLREYELKIPNEVDIVTSYYKERKICVIGTDNFNSPIRAINPQLKRKIDGSNTLTFSIYAKYYDELEESFIENPFLKYLTNERKVKLKYKEKNEEKWLDFVIKNISENSETFLYTYTATDLFVNELSKTGFGLVFDEKTNNNIGSVNQLGEKIIEGTDWRIGKNTEIIQQKQEEALYKISLKESITAINTKNEVKTFQSNDIIYTFYNCVLNKEQEFFQFLYREDGQYLVDENQVIINADEYHLTFNNNDNNNWPYFANTIEYTNQFRGERFVRQQKQVFDNTLQKYVFVYENNDQEVYGYNDVQYISPELIRSYISNPSGFASISGWKQKITEPLEQVTFPSFKEKVKFQSDRLYTLKYTQINDNFLFNSGITDNNYYIKNFSKDEEYVFRMNCKTLVENNLIYPNCSFNIQIKTYKYDVNGDFAADDENTVILFEGNASRENDVENYFYCKLNCLASVNKDWLNNNKIGIFIKAIDFDQNNNDFYIIDAQFYKYALDGNGNECLPGGKVIEINSSGEKNITDNFTAVIQTKYYYYLPNQNVNSPDEIKYLYIGSKIADDIYLPKFNNNYEKIRSISATGSNRFNLLQTLAETFECWCRFDIKHKPNGEIMFEKDLIHEIVYDGGNSQDDINNFIDAGSLNSVETNFIDVKNYNIKELYRPLKFITFHQNIGQINNVDIIYGINLKSITRTLESNNIITKMIVKTNNNQFARQGGCDISRARENPTGGNILYNFNHYVSQGLLNYENFNNDLYSLKSEQGWLGFYVHLKKINSEIQHLNEEKYALLKSNEEINSNYTSSQLIYEANSVLLREQEEEFFNETKYDFDEIPSDSIYLTEEKIIGLGEDILRLRRENQANKNSFELAEKEMKKLKEKIQSIESQIENLLQQKSNLISIFENKYSRFIQEGPWTSEDYTDDELYYLDAESTLYNSSQPKVQYNIKVIEISALEGYENFAYNLGDITHIQDTEFFGWTIKDGRKTPYREKIVVTESTTNFDSPEKDVIKVQNYRTQFEDLFQRMAATTQKVEFYSGAYQRAANAVEADGSIAPEALDKAFSSNTHILQNANNQSVKWDDKGITTTNTRNPAEIVRIVSGGIFISNDGGATWSTGITGNGINAKTITTGNLNTGLITILNGDQVSFRWDSTGINAYKLINIDNKEQYDPSTFVRFDQYGLYGIKNDTDFTPKSVEEVQNKASFSLTWKGFKLKNSDENGSVEIDSVNDFVVYANSENKKQKIIQIGRLGLDEKQQRVYGITIKGFDGEEAFKATFEGLSIGGWKITKESFASDYNKDETPEMALYSQPQTAQISLVSQTEDKLWRMIVQNNFGIDSEGNMYVNNANFANIKIGAYDKTSPSQAEISEEGIKIRKNETNEIVLLSWEELIDLKNLLSS